MTVYRATQNGVVTSLGGLLASGEDYEIKGAPHPDDAASIDAGRLVKADNAKPPKPAADTTTEEAS